ncbi:MAG: phosphotransferase enzyme family protein [Candidatus Hodarchaeales archaeon]|jgi:Ser/Thr protein kinase RdoA (MazF antagonist)
MAFEISTSLLQRIACLYNIDNRILKPEGGFDHLFYGYSIKKQDFLIRIKTDWILNKKSFIQIKAEIDWINYLAQNEIPVSEPQLSCDNKYVEDIIIDNNSYIVVSFRKAPGNYINFRDPEEWKETLWEKMGEILGKMHSLSVDFIPNKDYKRTEFEEDIFLKYDTILDKQKDKYIIKVYNQLISWMSTLHKPRNAYGMVHGDLNWGNYYIHNKTRLTLFDFDSCCYSWFIYDMAILIYSLIWDKPVDTAIRFLNEFIPAFYKGYSKNYTLDNKWIKLMSDFLYFHDFFLYTAITETINAGNTTEDYPSMLKIIRKRCVSGESKEYLTEEEWILLFQNHELEI